MPQETFLTTQNFTLAFERLKRSANGDYKVFYRHLLPSFEIALGQEIDALLQDIGQGTYEPARTELVHQPKPSGLLRSRTILSLRDLLVYQAIANVLAENFSGEQRRLAHSRRFAAIATTAKSPYFLEPWRDSYDSFTTQLERIWKAGNQYVLDFDLTAYYDLIDHELLRERLSRGSSEEQAITLLVKCLASWTDRGDGRKATHGIPQGPEASAFLAEVFLFDLDDEDFGGNYLRYVDDFRVLTPNHSAAERALMMLDHKTRELGLVPQSSKTGIKRVTALEDLRTRVPSNLVSEPGDDRIKEVDTQKALTSLFRSAVLRKGRTVVCMNDTLARYSLFRLTPKQRLLPLVRSLAIARPDMSDAISYYLRAFGASDPAAQVCLGVLERDPQYAGTAADYLNALRMTETESTTGLAIVDPIDERIAVSDLRLRTAKAAYLGARSEPRRAARLVEGEPSTVAQALTLDELFAGPEAVFRVTSARSLFQRSTESENPDLARFASAAMAQADPSWRASKRANPSAKRFMFAIGRRSTSPTQPGVLDHWFKKEVRIGIPIDWRRALGREYGLVESRCASLRMERTPSGMVMALDTFNEALIRCYSLKDPILKAAYAKARGTEPVPDWGNWVRSAKLATMLPQAQSWLLAVHTRRTECELAHHFGKRTGKPNDPVTWNEWNQIRSSATLAWGELIKSWHSMTRPAALPRRVSRAQQAPQGLRRASS